MSTNHSNDTPGTIFASRIAGNGSTVPRKKSGRDEARRISCSTGKHVAEVKRGLINHIHRYNVYTRPTFCDLRAYVHIRVSYMHMCMRDPEVVHERSCIVRII